MSLLVRSKPPWHFRSWNSIPPRLRTHHNLYNSLPFFPPKKKIHGTKRTIPHGHRDQERSLWFDEETPKHLTERERGDMTYLRQRKNQPKKSLQRFFECLDAKLTTVGETWPVFCCPIRSIAAWLDDFNWRVVPLWFPKTRKWIIPIGSMGRTVYLPTCWVIFMVSVGKNTGPMDPMEIWHSAGNAKTIWIL